MSENLSNLIGQEEDNKLECPLAYEDIYLLISGKKTKKLVNNNSKINKEEVRRSVSSF